MAKFRKKPVVIEAFRLNERGLIAEDWFWDAVTRNDIVTHCFGKHEPDPAWCEIKTLEGTMIASAGDYIIQGVHGVCRVLNGRINERRNNCDTEERGGRKMTREEAEAFAIVFLKGAASVDDVMNEAELSDEEVMKGINSLIKKGLLVIEDDGIEHTANEYGDCIAVGRNPPLWGLSTAAKKTTMYKLMVEAQAHFQKLLKTEGGQE